MRMKKKPDLLAVLIIVVGLGVIATTLAQGMLAPADTGTHLASNQTNTPPGDKTLPPASKHATVR